MNAPTTPATAAEILADYALASQWDELPAVVRHEAVRALVNWVAVTIGGSVTEATETAVHGVAAMQIAGDTPLLGRTEKFDMAHAALLNCLGSSSQTFDDTHLPTITHPTGPVAAAIHALIGKWPTTGKAFITALAIGIEIECRISNAIVGPGKSGSGGWYITGVTGGIGAAAAAGLLIGLPRDQLISAIGLGTAQASGTRSVHGSMAITFVPGIAARNGVTAALFASAGFTANPISIDGRNGMLEVYAPGSTTEDIVGGLGEEYELLKLAYKPYPCGIVIHPAIDACLEANQSRPLALQSIDRVLLRTHPDAMRLCWRKQPADDLAAQVSLFHWTAAAILHGKAGLDQGTLAAVRDPDIRALQDRIDVETDAGFAPEEASCEIRFSDGSQASAHIPCALGSALNPMSDAQLSAKFLMLADPILGEARAAKLLAALWACADAPDMKAVFA